MTVAKISLSDDQKMLLVRINEAQNSYLQALMAVKKLIPDVNTFWFMEAERSVLHAGAFATKAITFKMPTKEESEQTNAVVPSPNPDIINTEDNKPGENLDAATGSSAN